MATKSKFLQTLSDVLDISKVVDFRTFVESEEYLGLVGVYPYWMEQLNPRLNRKTSRCIFRGSTGSGKSTVMNLVLLYKIYLLFMQGSDVTKTLRLMKGTPVYCLYFSVSMTQAKRSGFAQLRAFIDGSKWFTENFPRDKTIDSSVRFPNNFFIEYASGEGHQIGLNVWGFILDEANFRKAGSTGEGSTAEFDEVYHLASQLENRLAQRFLRNGVENFFAGYISSASYETAFIQDKGDDYKDVPTAIVLDPVLFKVDPTRYTSNRFEVFFGFGEVSPCVVKDEKHREDIIRSLSTFELTPDKVETLFEKVPLELKKQFEENIYLAIQNICGRPTALRGSFITNYDLIKESYTSQAPSPFSQDSVTVSNKVDIPVHELISIDVFSFEDSWKPHSLFMDISLQGDYGSISCVRYDGEFAGVKYHSHVFTLEIIPPAFPAATDLTKVQNFIIWLAQYINIVSFGSDQYQCLVGDTLIPTTKGVKKLEEIEIGDRVFSHSGVCTVVNKFRYENAPVVKVKTKRKKEFICTPNHRMSSVSWCHSNLEDKSVVRLGNSTSDSVYKGKKYSYRNALVREFVESKDLAGKSLEMTPQLFMEEACTSFPLGLSEEWAEYLGWMTGDGGITYHKDGRSQAYLCCGKDEWEVIEDLHYRVTGVHKSKPEYESGSYSIKLPDRLTRELLKVYPAKYSALDKDIPSFIENASLSILSAYLRGLFSADGHCSKSSKQVVLTTVSESLAKSVRRVLEVRYGITCNITIGKRKYKGDYKTNNEIVYRVVTCGCLDHFVQIGFIQGYKEDALGEALSCIGRGVQDRVVSVEDAGLSTVYDIEVDSPDHSYYTCDFLTHNSSQIRQEVVKALDIPDVRVSLDSTDLPHLSWLSACASHRFKMKYYDRLDKEIREAVHDIKRRRVVKRKGSSDDQFQSVVGAYFLSDTLGSTTAQVPERVNVVGAGQAQKLMASVGFNGSVSVNPDMFMRRLATEERLQARTRSKFSEMLDSLNDF